MTINNRTSQSKNYIKEFDDFSVGYQELISVMPELKDYAGTESSYDTVVQHILNMIADNIPSPKNPNFPNTISFSINSREVGLLTDDKVAFGWRIFFNRESGTHIYQFRVTFLSVSMSKKKYIDGLLNNGWKEFDFVANGKQQSKFWYRLNSPRRNNNRQQNYNRENSHNRQQNLQEDNDTPATEEQLQKLKGKFNGTLTEEEMIEQSSVEEQFTEPVEQPIEEHNESIIETPEVSETPDEIFSIKKGNIDGSYIITCGKEGPFTINFNGDIYPEGSEVDREKQVIKYNGIVYNCLDGSIYKEED